MTHIIPDKLYIYQVALLKEKVDIHFLDVEKVSVLKHQKLFFQSQLLVNVNEDGKHLRRW